MSLMNEFWWVPTFRDFLKRGLSLRSTDSIMEDGKPLELLENKVREDEQAG